MNKLIQLQTNFLKKKKKIEILYTGLKKWLNNYILQELQKQTSLTKRK